MHNRPGAGCPYLQPLLRDGIHRWFVGLRFSIDWKALAQQNNAKGRKCLCRFPKSLVRWKSEQLQVEYTLATMLSGDEKPPRIIKLDAHWFARFENQYGFSFKRANRRFEVARHVRHLRMCLFWISLFRVRKYICLVSGYDPVLWNFDETPDYQNECGAQDKATFAMQGALVPLVENKGKAHSRWTANLSCCSCPFIIRERWPWAELMCKAADFGSKVKELQEARRKRNISDCISVTTAPKATYRELDIIDMLNHHLPNSTKDQRWEI